MGWRRFVHKITRRDMTTAASFTRDDITICFHTGPDGESLRHACLSREDKVLDQVDGIHEVVAGRIILWIKEFS